MAATRKQQELTSGAVNFRGFMRIAWKTLVVTTSLCAAARAEEASEETVTESVSGVEPISEILLPTEAFIAVETDDSPLLDGVPVPIVEGDILPPLASLPASTETLELPEELANEADLNTSNPPPPILPGLDVEDGEGFDANLLDDLIEPKEEQVQDVNLDLDSGWGTHSWGGSRLKSYNYQIRGNELLTSGLGIPMINEGFRFGLGIQANYDSNIQLLERNVKDDFFLLISPGVEYRSGPPEGVPGIFTFRYEPIIRRHLNDTSLDTIDQSAFGGISFEGNRSSFRAEAEYGEFAQSNAEVLSVADTKSYSFLIEGNYRVSEKLSANALWTHTGRDLDTASGISNDTELSALEFSLSWSASPRLQIGPSIRHAESDSDSLGKTETLGASLFTTYRPVSFDNMQISLEGGYEERDRSGDGGNNFTGGLRLKYSRGEEWLLRASLEYQTISELSGVDFSGTSGGDERLTGRFFAHYTPDQKQWEAKMSAAIRSIPSSTSAAGQSTNSSTIEAELIRLIGISRLSVGAELDLFEYDGGGLDREDDTTTSAFMRYARPVFADQASFSTTLRISENSGSRDWSRVQVSSGLQFSF